MFIIDFDDTLFDTHGFKMARLEALKGLGVSEELYWQTYNEAYKDDNELSTYSDKKHAQVLSLHGFNEGEVFNKLDKISNQDIKNFLIPEVFDFLEFLKQQKQPMVLLSLGDPDFQEFKTSKTGVSKYFDRTFMVDDTKKHVLEELFSNGCKQVVWFINDKPGETQRLLQEFPKMKVVMKQCSNFNKEEYQKLGLPYFKTLVEIKDYIENYE